MILILILAFEILKNTTESLKLSPQLSLFVRLTLQNLNIFSLL